MELVDLSDLKSGALGRASSSLAGVSLTIVKTPCRIMVLLLTVVEKKIHK